jgi:hypothetical protein
MKAWASAQIRYPRSVTAAAPLWLTVMLALLTPIFTLGGVLWTQYAADRRAAREAALRLDNDLRIHKYNSRRDLYTQVASALEFFGIREPTPDDFDKVSRIANTLLSHAGRVGILASPRVAGALEPAVVGAATWRDLPGDTQAATRVEVARNFLHSVEQLLVAMREDLA